MVNMSTLPRTVTNSAPQHRTGNPAPPRVVKKFGRVNSQINATGLRAAADNPAPSALDQHLNYPNKTAAQPSVGSYRTGPT